MKRPASSLPPKRTPAILLIGGLLSTMLLLAFFVMQWLDSKVLALPAQWLWIALVPVVICLVAGGYVTGISVGDYKADFRTTPEPPDDVKGVPEVGSATIVTKEANAPWQEARRRKYEETDRFMLVHVYTQSNAADQVFDAFIYLVRHRKSSTEPAKVGFSEVKQVEFFLGPSWNNHVFTVTNNGNNVLGIRVHAFGTFLAICRVTFRDGRAELILDRYVDCEMLRGERKT